MPYHFTKVGSMYGSPMGRTRCLGDGISPCKLHLERIRLNMGGYDSGGAYWGTGTPLYVAHGYDDREAIQIFVRASNRQEAKETVQRERKNVSFYR